MPLEQYSFGAGNLFATRTDIANPTPSRFGTLQDISVDFSFTVKELMGQYQAPVAVRRGGQKITGKIKQAKINARAFNDVFIGQTLTNPGRLVTVTDEGGPGGTAIPTTPFQLTVANSSSISGSNPMVDLGVYNAATGTQFTRVASAPAAGQYSVALTTGIYTFASADNVSGIKVVISYQYVDTTGGGRITASNQLMGSGPIFKMVLGNSDATGNLSLVLYQCIATKLSFGWKNEDFMIPEMDFSAFADSTGKYFDWSVDDV